MRTIILLPTYNEIKNIDFIISDIYNNLPDTKILVIDDNSPDGTADRVKQLMKNFHNLDVLEREKKEGLGEAYKYAMKKVLKDDLADVVITMDADGSHKAEYLKDFIKNVGNYDLLIGSRYIKNGGIDNWEVWRRKLSSWGNIYSKILTGLNINDLTAGFICARRELLLKIDFDEINSAGYAYQIEFKYFCKKAGARIKEIPIKFGTRREGESKVSKQIVVEGLKTPLKIFFKRVYKK